jgi:hypothetical protein
MSTAVAAAASLPKNVHFYNLCQTDKHILTKFIHINECFMDNLDRNNDKLIKTQGNVYFADI